MQSPRGQAKPPGFRSSRLRRLAGCYSASGDHHSWRRYQRMVCAQSSFAHCHLAALESQILPRPLLWMRVRTKQSAKAVGRLRLSAPLAKPVPPLRKVLMCLVVPCRVGAGEWVGIHKHSPARRTVPQVALRAHPSERTLSSPLVAFVPEVNRRQLRSVGWTRWIEGAGWDVLGTEGLIPGPGVARFNYSFEGAYLHVAHAAAARVRISFRHGFRRILSSPALSTRAG